MVVSNDGASSAGVHNDGAARYIRDDRLHIRAADNEGGLVVGDKKKGKMVFPHSFDKAKNLDSLKEGLKVEFNELYISFDLLKLDTLFELIYEQQLL